MYVYIENNIHVLICLPRCGDDGSLAARGSFRLSLFLFRPPCRPLQHLTLWPAPACLRYTGQVLLRCSSRPKKGILQSWVPSKWVLRASFEKTSHEVPSKWVLRASLKTCRANECSGHRCRHQFTVSRGSCRIVVASNERWLPRKAHEAEVNEDRISRRSREDLAAQSLKKKWMWLVLSTAFTCIVQNWGNRNPQEKICVHAVSR